MNETKPETQQETHCTAMSIYLASKHAARGKSFENNSWGARHYDAVDDAERDASITFRKPSREQAFVLIMRGLAIWADAYYEQVEGEQLIGEDGYESDLFETILRQMKSALSCDMGRLDGGTMSQLIADIAQSAGVGELD